MTASVSCLLDQNFKYGFLRTGFFDSLNPILKQLVFIYFISVISEIKDKYSGTVLTINNRDSKTSCDSIVVELLLYGMTNH